MLRRSNARPSLTFDKRLVLNQFMLRLLGVDNFETLAAPLRDPALESLDENGVSLFYHALVENLPRSAVLTPPELLAFDENIVRHTRTINGRRGEAIRWKYFQYLALLFTEIYLDRYFREPEMLRAALNRQVAVFNAGKAASDQVQEYSQASDLTKLAYWMATGAGKTLLMHVNILQYRHYLERFGAERDLNRIVLLTPNEGLSRQHLDEFRKSGMQAELFSKEGRGLYAGRNVEIIDINKLREEGREKTVSVEAFGANNLVLVDEGHRGAGGETWMDMRNRLAEKGFSFEYSATFGQAMKATSGKPELVQEYARAILFDYSYKFFYGDGYGKDFRILNLEDDRDEEIRLLYLTAGLLTFYQQLRLYADKRSEFHPYLLEKPLWIFVGASVNAVRSENKRAVSDVVDILLFFARFADPKQRAETIAVIDRFLRGQSGLLDGQRRELFPLAAFDHLVRLNLSAETVYADIFERFFNAGGPGALHVENLKGAEGEIAVRLGNNDPFGVINVGDASKLIKLCEEHPEFVVQDSEFGGSLFRRLDDANSKVNLLVGSKKFTEGWSSWRVSSMGLMNLGRGEGTQIIQLFGRGVRLRGYQFSLKRSSRLPDASQHPISVRPLETLNIFGVRADYMAQFREYLEDEGVPTREKVTTILLPVIIPAIDRRLLALKVKDGLDFKRQGPIPTLNGEPPKYLRENKVVVDWYPRIQARQAVEIDRQVTAATTRAEGKLTAQHVAFLDLDALYFELVRFKNERAWHNLNLSRAAIEGLLGRGDWYTLYIPPNDLAFNGLGRVARWQEMALTLLKKYVDRFYKYSKAAWEQPHLQYVPVTELAGNFAFEEVDGESGYRTELPADEETIAERLRQLRQAILDQKLGDVKFQQFASLVFDRHLYRPIICIGKGSVIRVSPQALNEGEQKFVEDLRTYYQSHQTEFARRELYLLRNQSRGRGLGFFEAGNFYPDFILWLLDRDRQYITFIDPKGIRNLEGLEDPKIKFRETVKGIQARIGDPDVILHSFILSNTPRAEVEWWNGGLTLDEFAQHHVLFQAEDQRYVEKLFGRITQRPYVG